MAADHFCLRWNNHQSTLVSVFDDLLESETLVDCTLAADGKYLKAHKVVLSACSPYLGMILSQHYDQHPIIILKDVKYEEMKAMLDYMYRGEVNISQEHLATFLKAAECLQIKGLTDVSSLNEEANKKQLQVERPPSSDESTTSAPIIDDDIPSREGSCSPTPKKMKQEVLSKNNIESNRIEKEVRAGITDVVSDLSVRNSVSSAFKHTGSDVAKNSIYVKKEPLDEPSYDGVMPSNVKGSEESKKGIPRPGPSNGSNSSIVGSPWLMSVDSTGDEMQLGSEQGVKIKEEEEEVFKIKEEPVIELVSRRNSLEECILKNGKNQNEDMYKIRNNNSIKCVKLLDDSKSCTFNTDSLNLKECTLSKNYPNNKNISTTPSFIKTTKLEKISKKYFDNSTHKWRKILPKPNQVVTEQTSNVLSIPCRQFLPKTVELKAKPLPVIIKISNTIPSNDLSCTLSSDKITGNKLLPIEVNKYKLISSLPCISSHVSNSKSVPSNNSIPKSVTIACKKLSDLQSHQPDLRNEPEQRTCHQQLELVKSINKNTFNIFKNIETYVLPGFNSQCKGVSILKSNCATISLEGNR